MLLINPYVYQLPKHPASKLIYPARTVTSPKNAIVRKQRIQKVSY